MKIIFYMQKKKKKTTIKSKPHNTSDIYIWWRKVVEVVITYLLETLTAVSIILSIYIIVTNDNV